jgi:glycosyltransferase involved in cell wall biosynthesis
VDTGRFTRIEHARPACTVCFIGRLSEEKGIDILVESAPLVLRDVPEARFVVRGVPFTVEDRDFFARVKRRIEDLGLTSTFEFPDYVREIPDLLRRIDVLVVPSRRDAMPRVVLEAMALGKPVVAASVGGLPEQISNGKTGLLVRPASAEDLADAVVNLLRHPDLARSMGLEGRRVVEERYSLAATTKSIAGVYAEIVHSG